jgi:proliferating cell nuclear antigen PCNA
MNIIIKNPIKSEIFALIFQHLKVFTDHVIIMFEKERLYFQSMDSCRISVFELSIPADWFDTYDHTSSGTVPIGLSSTLLFKILNTRDKIQQTEITFDTDNSDFLNINFTSEDKSVFDKRFELPLMDIDNEIMTIPEMESNAEFAIASASFANIISQLKLFGDTIDVQCTEEKIELKSLSDGAGKMAVDIQIEELSEYSIDEGETINLSFTLNTLGNICLYHKIAKEVKIKLIKDYPMQISYNFGTDPASEDTRLIFYLAPKIKDDE